MRIDLVVQYQCGCTETVRTDVNLPADLAKAERTPENDRRISEHIVIESCDQAEAGRIVAAGSEA